MKKILALSSSFIPLAFAPIVYAAGTVVDCNQAGQFTLICGLTGDKFGSVFGQIITFAFVIAVVVALAFLVWGGIKWVTSGGEKGGVDEARNHVIAAVVGLIIVFLSYFILNLIVFFFTGKGISTLDLPQLHN
jgi:hypothetical protein